MRFIPVGGYEADGIFHLHFGQAYELNVQRDLQVEKKDEHAMQTVMGNMARLLPVHLRGEFT
jgi:hypothetical protein